MDGAGRPDAGGYLWRFAAILGIAAIVLSGMLVILRPPLTLRTAFLVGITGFLYVSFAIALFTLYQVGREAPAATGPAVFTCKHCGRGFATMKLGAKHQASCVEMRI